MRVPSGPPQDLRRRWGFALYRASNDDYDDTLLPDGNPSGTPEQALNRALGLYLVDPRA